MAAYGKYTLCVDAILSAALLSVTVLYTLILLPLLAFCSLLIISQTGKASGAKASEWGFGSDLVD